MISNNQFSGQQILNWKRNQLLQGGREVELDWLLDIGGGLGWSEIQKLKISQKSIFDLAIPLDELSLLWNKHLEEDIPLQHLVGKCPWRDFELAITPSVLIPRPETELLIDIALKKINYSLNSDGIWADLGTGSGALAIALARSLPKWIGHAVEISEDAISVAEKNIKTMTLDSKVFLHLGHWFEPLRPWWGEIDLIVSNPPYIPSSTMQKLEPMVFDHEPHVALCGGADGLDSCREIIYGAIRGLSSGGWLIFEHHFDQSDRVLDLLTKSGFVEVGYENDLEGIRRFAFARHP